jgi:hypothetical protein
MAGWNHKQAEPFFRRQQKHFMMDRSCVDFLLQVSFQLLNSLKRKKIYYSFRNHFITTLVFYSKSEL